MTQSEKITIDDLTAWAQFGQDAYFVFRTPNESFPKFVARVRATAGLLRAAEKIQ